MAVYTETKTYHTKAHMGMIDVTEDFRHAVEEAARQENIRNGTITGFTTGGVAALTTLEFDLLAFLAQNPGQVFSYEQLYDRVWKTPINQGLHNIQVCMARVRQKLERLCPGQPYIETVRRKGYRFRPSAGA